MAKVFSGVQPSGKLHLGNYLGAFRQWIDLQSTHEAMYCIVDLHAVTVPYDPKTLPQRTFETAVDLLSIGLDPKKITLFVQSQVHEHAELAWLLGTITPLGELERMTQFKDKSHGKAKGTALTGLLTYPVLMAADILLYKADVVPVGEDQLQHIELARKIARKFNNQFGMTFPEPRPHLMKPLRIMSLEDPEKKMSKSDSEKGYIALSDEPSMIEKKIKAMPSATAGGGSVMTPGVENIFALMREFIDVATVEQYIEQERKGTIQYGEVKRVLAEAIADSLAPFREKRAKLLKRKGTVADILGDGAKKARKQAEETLAEVKEKMGIV
ncbi:MAG: tryptophan--tRNA ligase [Patescibacteria group bacterium]|jgi:tryptophanyl-tRNA synthetase